MVERAFAAWSVVHAEDPDLAGASDGAEFLALCALVRLVVLADADDARRPADLIDLTGATAPAGPDDPVRSTGRPVGVEPDGAAARRALLAALGALDDRDRVLLWCTATGGTMPADLAQQLSIGGVDAAATMTWQARSRLSRAYLAARMAGAGTAWPDSCRSVAARMVDLAAGSLVGAAVAETERHLRSCNRCGGLFGEVGALPASLGVEAAATTARLRARLSASRSAPRPRARVEAPRTEGSGRPETAHGAPTVSAAAPMVISTTPFLDGLPGPTPPTQHGTGRPPIGPAAAGAPAGTGTGTGTGTGGADTAGTGRGTGANAARGAGASSPSPVGTGPDEATDIGPDSSHRAGAGPSTGVTVAIGGDGVTDDVVVYDDTRAVPGSRIGGDGTLPAAGAGGPANRGDGRFDDGWRRGRAPVIIAVTIAAVVIVGVIVWLAVGRSSDAPVRSDPGVGPPTSVTGGVASTSRSALTTEPATTDSRATSTTDPTATTTPRSATTVAPSRSGTAPRDWAPPHHAPATAGSEPTTPPTQATSPSTVPPTASPTAPPTAPITDPPPTAPATTSSPPAPTPDD